MRFTELPRDGRASAGDYNPTPIKLRGVAGADGTCTLHADPVPVGYVWLLDYFVSTVKTSATPTVTIYDNDTVDLFNLLDGTAAGASAVGYYDPPRRLPQSQVLTVVWTGCNVGDECQLRIEYHVGEA